MSLVDLLDTVLLSCACVLLAFVLLFFILWDSFALKVHDATVGGLCVCFIYKPSEVGHTQPFATKGLEEQRKEADHRHLTKGVNMMGRVIDGEYWTEKGQPSDFTFDL